jgi:hypothetical protein
VAHVAASLWRRGSPFGDSPACLALGAVPFAKLQAVPVALFIALAAFSLIGAATNTSRQARLKAAGFLAATGFVIPVVITAGIYFGGQWGEFKRDYIQANIVYLSGRTFPWSESPERLLAMINLSPGFGPYLWSAMLFFVIAIAAGCFAREGLPHRIALLSLGLLLVSAFAVVSPGRSFFHYLHFLYFPLALGAACFLGSVYRESKGTQRSPSNRRMMQDSLALLYIGVCLGPQIAWRLKAPFQYEGLYSAGHSVLTISDSGREIMNHARSTDSLAVWGWAPRLWVETGLRQGTRDGNTSRQIESSPLRDEFQRRYLSDLIRNKPAVFVDAVGVGNFISDRAENGHEEFPVVARYIEKEYRFVREVEAMRIYVRTDLP